MRPLIHPALARVWRDATTIQIGLDPTRALVLSGLTAVETAVLRGINGTSDKFMLRSLARDQGGDPATADRLLDILRGAGVLVDNDLRSGIDEPSPPTAGGVLGAAGTAAGEWADVEHMPEAQAPDRASLGLLTGAVDGGAAAMQARNAKWVEVRGAGRVGAELARLIAAAGIGRTTVIDPEPATAHDITPGGLGKRHVGRPRGPAVQSLIGSGRATGTGSQPRTQPAGTAKATLPSLVVLAPPAGAVGVNGADALLSAGVPHLAVRVVELTGVVGPLVVPGRTSCLRCLDLHRRDRDPAWPRLVAQADHRLVDVAACDVALAAQVAAFAAQQVLAHLDGFSTATTDGTVEVTLPYGLPRRRSWAPHPACGCTWG